MSSLLGIGGGGNVGSAAGGSFYSYSISNSMRLDGSTAYLTKSDFGSATDTAKRTFSTWIKTSNVAAPAGYNHIIGAGSSGIDGFGFAHTTEKLQWIQGGANVFDGNRVLRDTSAWYHFFTTWNATDNELYIYVNGELDKESTSALSALSKLGNTGHTTYIGKRSNAGTYIHGYLAETVFLDGTIGSVSDFGETVNGVWVPKNISAAGLTYGNNGFYLDYADSSDLGKDVSGQGNHFTSNGLAAEDQVPDSPTNNFCTWNPLIYTNQTRVFKDGNLNLFSSAQTWSTGQWNQGTIGVTGGTSDTKFYFEFIANVGGSGYIIGVGRAAGKALSTTTYDGAVFLYNTQIRSDSTVVISGLTSASALDVIRIAFDASNGKVWIGNASGWFNSGDPAAGTNEVGTISNYEGEVLVPILNRPDLTNGYMVLNFGQDDTFAGNKTSGSAAAQDDNSIGKFYFTPPTGFLALCTSNLPEPSIGPNIDANDTGTTSEEHFNAVLWSGNSTNNRSITTDHATDFVWIKKRGTTAQSHVLADSVRGTSDNGGTGNNGILAISTAIESTNSSDSGIASFDSTGFTIGAGSNTANADAPYQGTNASGHTYVGWSWKAGGNANTFNIDGTGYSTASAASLDGGDITPTGASINKASGFSVIGYTGNGGAITGQTIQHGLDSAPELIFIKDRDTNSNSNQFHASSSIIGDDYGYLSTTAGFTGAALMKPTSGDSTKVTVGIGSNTNVRNSTNESGDRFIMYCFHSVDGFCKVGKYIGNGRATDGTFVNTGFRPAWLMWKTTNTTAQWIIFDAVRETFNYLDAQLRPVETSTENSAGASYSIDFLSNGFKLYSSDTSFNASNNTTLYIAYAESPFKYSLAR